MVFSAETRAVMDLGNALATDGKENARGRHITKVLSRVGPERSLLSWMATGRNFFAGDWRGLTGRRSTVPHSRKKRNKGNKDGATEGIVLLARIELLYRDFGRFWHWDLL